MHRKKVLTRFLLAGAALLLLLTLPAQAQTYPEPEVAWHYTEHYGDATDLAVGDLTGNGVADVAFIDTSSGTSLFALRGVDGVKRWQTHMVAGGYAIAVGDVNGDTANEVIAGSMNGTKGINVFNGSDGFFYFAYPTDSAVTDIELGDIDGDGTLDIIACDPVDDGWIYAINGTTGANLTGWPVGPLSGAVIDIALGNLDNAGGVDIAAISLSAGGTLYVYNSTGVQLWKNTSVMGRSVEIGDVDGDTEAEVVIGDYISRNVLVYDGDSDVLEYAFPTNGRNPTEVELGDLDGDASDLEIAVITGHPPDASLFALAVDSGQLNELWNFSIEWETGYYGEGLAIGDIDGDGRNEVIAASTSSDLKLSFGVWAFDGLDGTVIWMYELGPFLGDRANDLELGDVDGDGDLDVLVATTTNQAGQSVYALFTKEEPRVPLLTPLGTAALIGLLSVIATSTLVRRKRQ
ncbi:MAG: PQQ-like beta-propeller repeat protein [Methanomicrobia archaeon]|nr:PQQ-like beta-propeller repeat protein [Methanomicrobia archaeon]